MLIRYKKTGGFAQLLTLMETCGPNRREQLLKTIQTEDPGWAALLRTKMLSIERVFSWDAPVLAEIAGEIPTRLLAIALCGLSSEAVTRATQAVKPHQRAEIERLIKETTATPSEVDAARVKIIVRVRELEKDGRLNLANVDPAVSMRDARVA